MKDQETLQKENEDLRQEAANLKMQLKQSNASHQALDQSYGNLFRESHQLKTQCVLFGQEIQELQTEVAKLKEENSPKSVDPELQDKAA